MKDRNSTCFHCRLVLVVITVCLWAGSAAIAATGLLDLDIRSQRVDSALLELAEKAGVQIVLAQEITRNTPSHPVKGSYTIERALNEILKNTNLVYEFTSHNIVIITAAEISTAESSQNEKSAEEVGEDKVLEDIVIYGIRGSLEEALRKKRNANQVMDSISAEDIGKFPDNNLAEALQRIPGVTISRDDAGEGANVSIRGMGPDMNRVTLNGQVLASGGGVGNTGQGFSFEIISADMVSALEVWKSPMAKQDAGSTGGTVNIKTNGPLGSKRTSGVLTIERGYEDLGDHKPFKYAGRVSSQFFDHTFGITLGANKSEVAGQSDSAGVTSWQNPKGNVATAWDLTDSNGNAVTEASGVFVPSQWKVQERTANRAKEGVDIVLQWRPTDSLEVRVDALHAEQHDKDFAESLSFKFNNVNKGSQVGVVDEKGFVTELYASPKNAGQRALQLQTWHRDHLKRTDSLNGKIQWDLDDLTLTAQTGVTDGQRWMGQQFPVFLGSADISYDMNSADDPRFPTLLVNGEDTFLADDQMQLRAINNQVKQWTDDQKHGQFDADWNIDADFVKSVSAGVKYIEISQMQRVEKGTLNGSLGTLAEFAAAEGVDSTTYYPDTAFNSWTKADFDKIEAVHGAITDVPFNTVTDEENWDVDFEIQSFYVQADFDGELLGLPVRGNFGVRAEKTHTTSMGFAQTDGGTWSPVSLERDYSDVLPSLNMVFTLDKDLLLRLGLGKVMSRPIGRDLAPAYRLASSSTAGELGTGTGGNPFLDPFRANQIDLGLEWYFADGGLLSAGIFYKDIESFIARETNRQVIDGEEYDITSPVNGGGGKIKGYEVGYQQNFDFLPAPFDGFGGIFNYTRTDSSTDFVNAMFNQPLPMEGLSKNTVNASLYYETDRFSARVSYTYRDEHLHSGSNWSPTPIFLSDLTYVDASISYDLTDNIVLGFKANNLTDQELEQYVFEEQYPVQTITNGRTYAITASMKF